jgi:Predicted Zn-dependent peptidases
MENVGGELNAYTTKEETFIYAAFLEEYFPRAVELLSDIAFHSEFSPQQIDRERDVILDEIHSYYDSPSELIFDDFENLLFEGHDIGHYILGEPESLESFNKDRIQRFVRRQYHPSEMVFFSFGKTSFAKVVRQMEKFFSVVQEKPHSKKRVAPDIFSPRNETVLKNTAQSHVMIGGNTFSMHHPQKYALYMLNSIMGGGSMNSRLNASLREKHGLAYNVEMNVTFYTDTGFFAVYFACDPKNRNTCIKLIKKEVEKIKMRELTPMQLSLAKRQWKGQLGIASENNENSALSMAKTYLHFNSYASLDEIFAKIDAITASQIREVANDVFSSTPFELSYL